MSVLGIRPKLYCIYYKHRVLEKAIRGTDYCVGVFQNFGTVYCCNRKLNSVLSSFWNICCPSSILWNKSESDSLDMEVIFANCF